MRTVPVSGAGARRARRRLTASSVRYARRAGADRAHRIARDGTLRTHPSAPAKSVLSRPTLAVPIKSMRKPPPNWKRTCTAAACGPVAAAWTPGRRSRPPGQRRTASGSVRDLCYFLDAPCTRLRCLIS
ncbi:hypothetical protein Misp01_41810 [Microtetraspora sp. NBRC 13810]|nr:hypothetical protein Misp01_41810 [Microtetraspora sp. NBRC 13810]